MLRTEGPPICVGCWNVNNPDKLEVMFPIEHSTLTVGSSQLRMKLSVGELLETSQDKIASSVNSILHCRWFLLVIFLKRSLDTWEFMEAKYTLIHFYIQYKLE